MKKIILSIAIFFLFIPQSFSHVDHYAKYNYLEYELFRNNTSIGYNNMYSNTTGDGNTASGTDALQKSLTGSYNTGVGGVALYSNTTGAQNTALGYTAGYSNVTGSGNVFIGYKAGYNETGSNKLYIDNSDTSSPLIKGDFSANEVTINGDLEVTGTLTSNAIYHSNGTKMLSYSEGSVHIGPNSMVFTDASGDGADIMHSTVGKIQIGQSSSDSTTVKGSLTVEDPTTYYHAAHKGYVDNTAANLRSDMRKYDNQAIALSAALSSLPTDGGSGSHACGVGMGHRGQSSAMALGCAADFSHLGLSGLLPAFVSNASLNAGTSFLTDDNTSHTFKVGLTFNFGGPKPSTRASTHNWRTDNRLAQIERTNQQRTDNQDTVITQLTKDNQKILADNQKMQARLDALTRDKDQHHKDQKQNATIRNLKAELNTLRQEKDQELLALKTQMNKITALLSRSNQIALTTGNAKPASHSKPRG